MTEVPVSPAYVHITPAVTHYWASEFLRTVREASPAKGFTPVPYFLYCRALELGLKAFLQAKWTGKLHKREVFGHNLVQGLDLAKAKGLESFVTVSPQEEEEVKKANVYYDDKGFEYFDGRGDQLIHLMTTIPNLPDLEVLKGLVERLLEKTYQFCLHGGMK